MMIKNFTLHRFLLNIQLYDKTKILNTQDKFKTNNLYQQLYKLIIYICLSYLSCDDTISGLQNLRHLNFYFCYSLHVFLGLLRGL